jgi:hypothetical protein
VPSPAGKPRKPGLTSERSSLRVPHPNAMGVAVTLLDSPLLARVRVRSAPGRWVKERLERCLLCPWTRTSGLHVPLPRPPAPEALGPSTATAALPHDDPRRERQPPAAPPAREGLRPATPVPQAVAAGQHDALAAPPVRAGEHDPLPGLYASVSHAPSVAAGASPITVNPLEVKGGCASREPAVQVQGTCARGRAFRPRASSYLFLGD